MYEGQLGEYYMSYELKRREMELAHPRAAHRRELARIDARSDGVVGRPSLPARVRLRVARAWAAVAASVSATPTPAHDRSAT
jgi:hypothetical protein